MISVMLSFVTLCLDSAEALVPPYARLSALSYSHLIIPRSLYSQARRFSDIEALGENQIAAKDVVVDQDAEAKWPELKRQAQQWVCIAQDPNSDLFISAGCWSGQEVLT